jgi:Cu/Ag efflux pump CusA
VGVLAVASLAVLPQWGSRSLLPHLQDRSLLVHLATAPGTSVAEMDRVAGLVAEEVRQVPHVGDVGAHVGRAITSDQQVDVNEAELWLTLDDDADYAKTTAAVERVVTSYPGVRGSLVTYPEDTVAAAVDPDRDNLVVRVYGIDQTELARQAKRVLNKIRNVRGVVSPTVRTVPVQPAVHVQVDLARAAQYGLRPGDVRRDTTTLTSGLIVGSLYEEAKVFDVVVWGGPAARHSITDLENLRIDVGGSGRQVRLGDVASVTVASDPVVIEHHETSRSVDVVAQVSGRSPAAVAADVRAAGATLDKIPYEYHAEVLSGPERVWSDTVRTGLVAVAAVLFVLLLAQAATRSWRRSALLVALLPLSLAGAVLAGALTGGIHQVGALAALLGALVLTARQGLVVARTGDARSQLVPVVTTALATAALVLPAAVLGDRPGLESVQPFAVTLLGGLVSSTLVVLVVLPAFLPTPAPVAVEAAAAEAAEKERVVDITDPTTTTTEGSTP